MARRVSEMTATKPRDDDIRPAFTRIVCGIDGSRSSSVAAEQAIALSDAGTALSFVCVREARGAGATRQATITTERADNALEEALGSARDVGIDATAEILPGHDPRSVLVEASSRADLLVVASHGGSRAGGIALGSTASAAVHRARSPVLVARSAPGGARFPDSVLVATDGSADAARAVELTGRIARPGARVYVLSVDPGPRGDPSQIAVGTVDLTTALGREPTSLRLSGHPDECIVETAANELVTLVAVGSRGLTGVRALGSVSERVAHRAPCSVLVARASGDRA